MWQPMGLTPAQENARNLLRDLSIADPTLQFRRACAEIGLSASELRKAQREAAATTNTEPLRNVAASLVALGVSTEIACRICGIYGHDFDVLNRRRAGAAEDEPGHSKAARSTPAMAHGSEDATGSEGA